MRKKRSDAIKLSESLFNDVMGIVTFYGSPSPYPTCPHLVI